MRLALALLFVCGTALAAPDPSGYWLGTLDVGAAKLRIGFHVERRAGGAFSSTLASLDQGVRDLPTDATTFVGSTFTVDAGKLGARFAGKMTPAGDAIQGVFSQAGHDLPLVLKRVAAYERAKRPQEPKPPFPYRTEEVQVVSGGVTLGGTLTLPAGKGPFPAVLFITGSGPEDRDETVFDGHRPFLVIADALTKAGVATLRLDDRGVGKSGGSQKGLTTLDLAKDALVELTWLVKRPEIDAKRVGLIGHSEGGLIAPIVAAQSELPRFLVLLAGTGVVGREVLRTQQEKIVRASGGSDADVKRAQSASDDSPWMRTFAALDPQPYLAKVKVPVLAMNGENDLQVDVSNLDAIRRGLAHDTHVEIVRLPGLNHLFQHCKTGLPTEYATIEETFAPEALDRIRAFVLAR